MIDNGWDNVVVEMNDELIFRFPRDAEIMFKTELEILELLQEKITLPIPHVQFLGKSYTYHTRDTLVLDFAEQTVREYNAMTQEKTEYVVLYNDLHTENMAFDAGTGRLNGLVDFSDVTTGDINRDFSSLYRFDPSFMKAVAEKYQELTGRLLNPRRMVVYARINELCDLAEYVDKPQSEIHKNAVTRANKWSKEMDLFE